VLVVDRRRRPVPSWSCRTCADGAASARPRGAGCRARAVVP